MRSLIIDMISFNPGIKYKTVAEILELNYENVRKIWHTYKTSNRRTKIYNKKFPHMRRSPSDDQISSDDEHESYGPEEVK